MTANQISFAKLQEDIRHNRVTEDETQRHNVQTEGISAYANQINEAHYARQDAINAEHYGRMDAETARANLAREAETYRANKERESLEYASIQVDVQNAETRSKEQEETARENQFRDEIAQAEYEEKVRHDKKMEKLEKERNKILQQQADGQLTDVETRKELAKIEKDKAKEIERDNKVREGILQQEADTHAYSAAKDAGYKSASIIVAQEGNDIKRESNKITDEHYDAQDSVANLGGVLSAFAYGSNAKLNEAKVTESLASAYLKNKTVDSQVWQNANDTAKVVVEGFKTIANIFVPWI